VSPALHLREQYEAVGSGYHLDKKHWNTVVLDGSIPRGRIEEMIEHSYERVVAGLPKAVRQRLAGWTRKQTDFSAKGGDRHSFLVDHPTGDDPRSTAAMWSRC
jgi:hypothetical protein